MGRGTWYSTGHFNPRAPCGARLLVTQFTHMADEFQSTRPVRGATVDKQRARKAWAFQSTRPVRGATCLKPIFQPTERFQSTRPVRGATEELVAAEDHNGFQSTRPVRGATASGHSFCPVTLFQSTRPVRGATDPRRQHLLRKLISIHAPRAGRDRTKCGRALSPLNFNPRAPCGARQKNSTN